MACRPANDANPREWKTRVGSDRRADPKFRRAAPPGGKKDSHRDTKGGKRADGGERKVAEFWKNFEGGVTWQPPVFESRFGFRYGGYLQPNEGERTATARSPQIGRSGGPADGNHRRALPPNFYFSVFPLTPHGSNRRGGSLGGRAPKAAQRASIAGAEGVKVPWLHASGSPVSGFRLPVSLPHPHRPSKEE